MDWTGALRHERFPLLLNGGSGKDTYSFDFDLDAGQRASSASSAPAKATTSSATIAPRRSSRGRRRRARRGGGPDVISGQGGDDAIEARDGAIDKITCAGGTDSVLADRFDPVSRDCETASRGPGV